MLVRRRSHARRTAAGLALAAMLAGACADADSGAEATAEPSETATADAAGSEASPTPSESPSPSETETEAELAEAPDIVRGVYSTVYSFWGERWAKLIDLVETTELNAIVVDVKDEAGTLLWHIDHPLADAGGGATWKPESDPKERLQMLLDAGGYAIARVACFKDTLVAQARPDLAVQDQGGNAWRARKDFSWLNPYQDEAGQWCIDVGLAAIEMGFHEVQFDYIRFPNGGDGDTSVIKLPGVPAERPREEWRHTDEITEFLARASEQIHDAGGLVSADLFGLVTYDFTWDAQGTGQVMEQIAEHVDFISPMVYPSHYGVGNYGLMPHPIEHPYETVWNSMQEAQMRVQGLRAEIRPWLEDFSAPWMGYPDHSPDHVKKQIQATYDNGIEGWLLWNAGNSYTESILAKGEAESHADPDFVPPYRTANPDAPPGVADEKVWPGMPPCKPDRERLEIGRGNLAGSVPPKRAPGGDEPIACKEEEPATTSTASASETAASDSASPSDDSTEQ